MIILPIKQFIRLALIILPILLFQSCSTVAPKATPKPIKKVSHGLKTSLPPQYANFDKKAFPNDALVISNMINIVQPEIDEDQRDTIASQISMALVQFKVEPQIIVAIIDTESNFQADKVSSTGDVSVAQINVEVWNKEFIRMKKEPLVKDRIKIDQEYALLKMVEILHILKTRYQKRDRRWYARYHSNTHRYKKDYLYKLEKRLKMLAVAHDVHPKIAQNN